MVKDVNKKKQQTAITTVEKDLKNRFLFRSDCIRSDQRRMKSKREGRSGRGEKSLEFKQVGGRGGKWSRLETPGHKKEK